MSIFFLVVYYVPCKKNPMVDETRWCWPRHEVEMKETKHSSSYIVMSV